MAQISLRLGYRPVRIGWCIKSNDMDSFRKVIALTSTMWGGRFNPIIPVNDQSLPDFIVKNYHVDVLASVSDDENVKQFINSYRDRLPWPFYSHDFFSQNEKFPLFLDIAHLIHRHDEARRARLLRGHYTTQIARPIWQDDDPLRDVFACTFGALSAASSFGASDYSALYDNVLKPEVRDLSAHGKLSTDLAAAESPLFVGSLALKPDYRYDFNDAWRTGVVAGRCDNFFELVDYWNMRAANIDVAFFDPRHKDRLLDLCLLNLPAASVDSQSVYGNTPIVWVADGLEAKEIAALEIEERRAGCLPLNFIRSNVMSPPRVIFREEQTVLCTTEAHNNHQVTIQLPRPPFEAHRGSMRQHLVATILPTGDINEATEYTFRLPNLPELNSFFGRKSSVLDSSSFRIQAYGSDIITTVFLSIVSDQSLARALERL